MNRCCFSRASVAVYKLINYPTLGASDDSDYAASATIVSSSFGMMGGSFFLPSASRSACAGGRRSDSDVGGTKEAAPHI